MALVGLVCATILGPAPASQSQTAAPTITRSTVSTAQQKNEVPRIDLASGKLHVTWKTSVSTGNAQTAYNVRDEGGSAWPAQQTVGDASGNGSFFTSSVRVNPRTGVAHLIWVDNSAGNRGAVFYSRNQNGQWANPVQVSTGSDGAFPHYPYLAIGPDDKLWAIWSAEQPGQAGNPDGVFVRFSTDGTRWDAPGGNALVDGTNAKNPWIAVDKSGNVHAVWYRYAGGIITYGRWDGTRWTVETLAPGAYSAQPSVTVDPSNNVHLAWRRIRGDRAWSIMYATRPAAGGTWAISKLLDVANTNYNVPIYADTNGTLHLSWFEQGSTTDIWYTNKPAGGNWSTPVNVTNDAQFNANPDVVGSTDGSGIRGHVVSQTIFTTDQDVRIEHLRVGAGAAASGCTGTVVLEGGAAAVNKRTLSGTITPRNCTPTEMQLIVDGVEQGRVAYNASFTVTIPDTNICSHSVAVRLFASGSAGEPASATIKVDTAATAQLYALNPNMKGLPTIFTPYIPGQTGGTLPAANDGAANYTRDRSFYFGIDDAAECAGLKKFSINGSISSDLVPGGFSSVVPLPGDAAVGEKTFTISIADVLSNTATMPAPGSTYRMVYDPASTSPTQPNTDGLPVLATGGAAAGDTNTLSIERKLTFSNISVNDNLYGQFGENLPAGRQFWGVLMANSPTDVGVDSPTLRWYPVPVASPAATFTVDWNLFRGLNYGPALDKPGTYTVYVRFLDGAGNASLNAIKTTVTLAPGYGVPKLFIPLVSR